MDEATSIRMEQDLFLPVAHGVLLSVWMRPHRLWSHAQMHLERM